MANGLDGHLKVWNLRPSLGYHSTLLDLFELPLIVQTGGIGATLGPLEVLLVEFNASRQNLLGVWSNHLWTDAIIMRRSQKEYSKGKGNGNSTIESR